MVVNKAVIYKKVPKGWPVPGEDLTVEDIGFDADAEPEEGGVTLALQYLSLDPYMRGRMRGPETKSYQAAFEPGRPLASAGVARVLKSRSDRLAAGDQVRGMLPFAQFAGLDGAAAGRVERLDNAAGLDARYFLGPLGMPGLTAYSSLHDIGRPAAGQTIFVSAASGAVGQMVGQLAKREGMRVVGSVGSEAKLAHILGPLGFDAGFNYKAEEPLAALRRLAPEGLDVYYDNVGGAQLQAALECANDRARFVLCGMISQYNAAAPDERFGLTNLALAVSKRLTLRGFIVTDPDMGPKYAAEFHRKVAAWIASGELKVNIWEVDGIDRAPEAFVGMLRGDNFGKTVVKVDGAA